MAVDTDRGGSYVSDTTVYRGRSQLAGGLTGAPRADALE